MAVCDQLPVGSESLERLLFKMCGVAVDILQHLGFQNEESPVDPTFFGLRFLGEFDDVVSVELDMSEACRRTNRGERRQLSVSPMKRQESVDVDVRNAVAPRQHEGAVRDVFF